MNLQTKTSTAYHLKWVITNFSTYKSEMKSLLCTLPEPYNNIEWNLKLQPCSLKKKHVSLYVQIFTKIQIDINVEFTFQDVNKKYLQFAQFDSIFSEDNCTKGYSEFIKNEEILPLENDTLIVIGRIKMNKVIESVSFKHIFSNSNNKLLSNFNELLSSNDFSDIILEARDESQIAAHKCILSAQSPVFKAMLMSDMKECQDGKVLIMDMDGDVLKAMLEFMYSHKFDNDSNLKELFVASNKYQIDHLKMMCEAGLCKQLTVENATEYLILADSYNNDFLKTKTLHFMKENMKDIIQNNSSDILSIQQPDLYYDIIKSLVL